MATRRLLPTTPKATVIRLDERVEQLRGRLKALHTELAVARHDLRWLRTAQLLEVNQQLVLSALRAESIAETAVSNLVELRRSSQRDTLTDTPNRTLMVDRLEKAIELARRCNTRIAVIFLDLDHFKRINDTLGHAVGDAALQITARRLESAVRDSDTVSRHSGDEFLVLLANVNQSSDAGSVAAKMLVALATPAYVGAHVLHLGASLGIAVFPEDAKSASELIERADAAMYRAKRLGGARMAFHRSPGATVASPASWPYA